MVNNILSDAPRRGPATAGSADRRGSNGVLVLAAVSGCFTAVMVVLAFIRAVTHRMIDLEVYRAGGAAVLHGHPLYDVAAPVTGLPFTYPPVAGVLAVPVSLIPRVPAQLLWTAANLTALVGLLAIAVRVVRPELAPARRWQIAVAALGPMLVLEPVRHAVGLGQVDSFLILAVLFDLARSQRPGADRSKTLGIGLGIASGVKLTPLLLVLHCALTGRRRTALTAAAAAAATALFGLAVIPADSWRYWTDLVWQPERTGPISYPPNQSLLGVVSRVVTHGQMEPGRAWTLLTVALSIAGLLLARRYYRSDPVLGDLIAVVTVLLASPISWSHHWLWVAPLILGLLICRGPLLSPRRVAGLGLWLLFALGPVRWVSKTPWLHPERGLELLAGNAYAIAVVLFLGIVAFRALRRRCW
ncbi:MAG: glycosyltransferase 87 family protein [Frankiaceae bacterium]